MGKRVCGLPNMQEIDQMSSNELREHLVMYRAALLTPITQVKSQKKQIENPMIIRQTKRTIARIITVLIRRGERVTA